MVRSLAMSLVCLTLFPFAAPRELTAQPANSPDVKPGEAPSLQIVVPDEPKAVGTTGLLPPALTQPLTIEFNARPLAEFVAWLRDEQKLPVTIDAAARRTIAQESLTDRLKDEPLELLLDRLFAIGLGWYLENGALHLTSPEEARSHLVLVRYNLGPLFDAGFEPERLIETIRKGTTGPWTGEETAGGTSVLVGDVLFVKQHQETHTEIAVLLSALARHGRRTLLLDPPQHAPLRAKLAQSISVDFDEIPLKEAIRQIAAKLDVELRVVPEVARGVNFDREPVKYVAVDQNATTILAVLSRSPLVPEVRAGAIWVASRISATPQRVTAVYDVRDLCLDFGESEALQEAIQTQVPGLWGQGKTVSGLMTFPKPGVLVVRQTLSGLDAISTLLEDYRAALRASKPRGKDVENLKRLELRMYRVPTAMVEEAESLLIEFVAPDSWKAADPAQAGTIQKATSQPRVLDAGGPGEIGKAVLPYSVLLIRQTVENHRAISGFLHRLEGGDGPPPATAVPGRKSGIGGFGRGFFPAKP